MNRNILAREFIEAVGEMRRTHDVGTYYWIIGEDEKNDWAIVLGWSDGFDPNIKDDCTDGTWRICAKLAYQSKRNIMQCDYDVDWTMPYDEETDEVYDNEISIYPHTDLKSVVNWLLECYDSYFAEDEEEYESKLLDKFMKERACRTTTDLMGYIAYLEDVKSDHEELKKKIANLNMLASEMY